MNKLTNVFCFILWNPNPKTTPFPRTKRSEDTRRGAVLGLGYFWEGAHGSISREENLPHDAMAAFLTAASHAFRPAAAIACGAQQRVGPQYVSPSMQLQYTGGFVAMDYPCEPIGEET